MAGFTRDYMFAVGQTSSDFPGSPAMALLKAIGPPRALVETDYRGSVAYFTGHRTAWTAFTATLPQASSKQDRCTLPIARAALRADDARFLVVGDVNHPRSMDSPCLLYLASTASTAKAIGAVRLLSTTHDQTSVFELVGPGSSQPALLDRTAGIAPVASPPGALGKLEPAGVVRLARNGRADAGGTGYLGGASRGQVDFTWSWPAPAPVTQISVGSLTSPTPVSFVTVSMEAPDHTWQVVASAHGAVGDGGVVPYLLAQLPSGTTALAVRVSALTASTATVAYLNAIGPTS
jgi:hypothetical protein